MIAENERFLFNVTHVEAEGELLKIWAQTNERIVQSVAAMLLPLQEKLEYLGPSNIISSNNLLLNTRCCARGINNDFCRAKVLNLRSDGMVLVQFIDYGNISYVPIHNIRLIDGLSEANYLFSVPDAATAFILADISAIGGVWLDPVVKQIRNSLIQNKFWGVYKTSNNHKILKFTMMEEDFGRLLIKRNMAVYSTMQQMTVVPVQPLRTPHQMSSISPENWRMPVSNITPVQKVVKTNSFKAIQLEIGALHEVQISYVEEGPCKFSVQLVDSIPYLNVMMDKINSQNHVPLQEPPIAGTVCLGKPNNSNRLFRVVLNSPGDTTCKVYYADYGYHEVLPFTSIYQIPDEFVTPNIFSIRFTLSGSINWTVTQDMKDHFEDLVHNKNLKLRVCKGPMSPLTQYCDLFLNGRSVKDILTESFPDLSVLEYPEPKRLPNGTTEFVFVSYVESITKFFVQIEDDLKLLDELMDLVDKTYNNAPKLNSAQLHAEMPCIALYDVDKKWYRASLRSLIDGDKAQVFYVDYGNEEVVPFSNLRKIPTQLVTMLPKQAIKCSLHGFQSGSMDSELTKVFENLVLEERLTLTVQNNVSNTVVVTLFDAQNVPGPARKDIAEKLKELELSKKQEIAIPDRHNDTNSESAFKPMQMKNENDNCSGNNWDKVGSQGQFRKDNESEQRHDNRLQKSSSEYSNGPQNNRFQPSSGSRDYSVNERIQRGTPRSNTFNSNDYHAGRVGKENQGNKTSINSRLDRSFSSDKSDKDSDTSSRSGGRRSNRGAGKRGFEDNRNRDGLTNNRNRIGRWENDEYDTHRKNYNGETSPKSAKLRSNIDSNSNFNKSRNDDWETSPKISPTANKDSVRYVTSTPISRIPPPNITTGAVKNCVMVYYLNPGSFFVQLVPDNAELDPIMDKIYSIYSTGENLNFKVLPSSEIKENVQCIAQYSHDEQWYRAVVKSVESSTATVHFLDYGNDESVSFEKIKEIDAEFLKLPAQAIHCKLFCPGKSDWTKEESDLLANETGKILEAEFVTEENGVYHVLIKEAIPNNKDAKYFNDLFANGMDLIKEKHTLRNKTKYNGLEKVLLPPDYALPDTKWAKNKLDPGTECEIHIAWFINPENFYCQLASQEQEFRTMMNEIQTIYAKREPVSEPLQVGYSVIAVLPNDGVMYRAEVLELNKPRGHVVQFIDYGDRAMVDPRKIYPVEKKFMSLPRQAILCGLKNIGPPSGSNWANVSEMGKIFNVEKYDCIFHELKTDKHLISMKANGNDIASTLVDKNLAVFSSVVTNEITEDIPEVITEQQEIPRIDLNLLEGQTLFVKVSSIEGVAKFYVQFYTYEACQETVDKFMASQDPQVMPRLLCPEVCLGAGCLVNCRGKWRRGVVIKFTKTNYEVRLIDTGEHEKISLNSMLGLPGQLARMQNQAIECSLFDVPLSTKADETFKKTVTGKDVKLFVEKVECNRLIVRLFDTNGNKIKVVDTQNTEKISPVCSMQLLNSTHNVISTWFTNSNNVWLQRTSDSSIEQKLLNDLFEHYSNAEGPVVPEENELYAGLSADGNWYRVKVSKIEDTTASVTFIDYGNVEDIPVENLRILESRFYLPHQLAINVSLTVSLSGDNAAQQDILDPLFKDKEFTATFYNVNRKWVAELTENGEKLSDKLSSLDIVKKATKTQFEFVELAEMVVGEKYDVVVSHIDNPNQLWLQRKEELNAIDELQKQLQEASSIYLDYSGVPEEKSLCLAVYSLDNLWYRAEVLDADDDITTVRFIDYGNTDVINNSINHLKQLPEKWKTIKKYAIQCKLDVVPVNADDWTEEACARVNDLAASSDSLQALIIADKAPMRIDLFADSQSFCKILVEEKLAAYLQSSDELEEEIVEEVELDPRSAFVSHIISVDQFWLQEEKWVKDLEMMADRLVMAQMFPALTEIKEGLACIAYYPGDNGYYRAVILSHNKEGTNVRFTDYGNSSVVKDLKTIPDDLVNIPPLSRKCCLMKPDGVDHWPPGITEKFVELAAGGATVFLLDVIEENETSIVKLTHNFKDVAMELLEMCEKAPRTDDEGIVVEDEINKMTIEARPSPIGEENSSDANVCSISYVSSPAEFWIHKKSHYPDLDLLMERLIDAEDFNIATEVKEGKVLAAKFDEDGKWYRSNVLSGGESGTEVLYIDYGNSAFAKSDDPLRELPNDLLQIPALAILCSLKMPEGLESWSRNACEKFINLAMDGAAEFRFEILDTGNKLDFEQSIEVSLFYENQDILEILLDEEIAESCNDKNINDQATELVSQESKGVNSSGDSAIHSEIEPHIDDSDPQTNPVTIIDDSSTSIEIIHDGRLSSTEIVVQEEIVTGMLNKKNEKADKVDMNQISIDDAVNEHNNLIGQEKLIAVDVSSSSIEEEIVTSNITASEALMHNEKVPSCVTKGKTSIDWNPTTPAPPVHAEKPVHANGAQENEQDEIVALLVKKDIPASSE